MEGEITSPDRYAGSNYLYRSNWQYGVGVGVGSLSGCLSSFGSASLIYLILIKPKRPARHNHHKSPWNVFHRIMLGLSIADLISSLCAVLQPFLVPQETHLPLALGNHLSCQLVAFGYHINLASTIYSCELALYFLVTICKGWSAGQTAHVLEPWVHVLPWTVAMAYGIAAIAMHLFNPSELFGWCLVYCRYRVGEDSNRCDLSTNTADTSKWMQIPLAITPTVCAFLGTLWTFRVYRAVRRQEKKIEKYDFLQTVERNKGADANEASNALTDTAASPQQVKPRVLTSIPSSRFSEVQRKRTKAVAIQAVCYCAAYLNSFLGVIAWIVVRVTHDLDFRVVASLDERAYGTFVGILILYLLHPLQGFLNWLIYVRPLLVRWKSANPNRSWWWAYRQVLSGQVAPTTAHTEHLKVESTTIHQSPTD